MSFGEELRLIVPPHLFNPGLFTLVSSLVCLRSELRTVMCTVVRSENGCPTDPVLFLTLAHSVGVRCDATDAHKDFEIPNPAKPSTSSCRSCIWSGVSKDGQGWPEDVFN